MASSWRFLWQGSHGRSSRSGIPSIIPSPPHPRVVCDWVLRFSLDDLFQRPASDGPRDFSCLGGVGWRPGAQPYNPHLRGVGM